MQTVFLLMLKPLGTLDRHAHHLSYQGGSKLPPHHFFVLTNLDCFDLGASLKKLCFKPRQWRNLYMYLFNRQTDRLTDRQTGRQTYIFCHAWAHRPHSTVCRWTVSKLSVNCICIVQVSEPYQTLVSLRQSILCDYDNITFFVGGGDAWYA